MLRSINTYTAYFFRVCIVSILCIVFGVGCGTKSEESALDGASTSEYIFDELSYYNLVIEQTNELSRTMLEIEQSFIADQESSADAECNFSAPENMQLEYTNTRDALLKKEVQHYGIHEELIPYLDQYADYMRVVHALDMYCQQKEFQADGGDNIDTLRADVLSHMELVQKAQQHFTTQLDEAQNTLQPEIAENTTQPDEMVIRIQNTLTEDVEYAQTVFGEAADMFLDTGTVDISVVQTAVSQLVEDTGLMIEKGKAVNVSNEPTLGESYNAYIAAVQVYTDALQGSVEVEQFNEQHIYTALTELSSLYTEVIEAHNAIVDALSVYTPSY